LSLAIECKGLQKIYRSGFLRIPYVGLKSLDLKVEKGEIFGFIGPNGAGKTTAMKTLMGLQRATAGEAFILGIDHRDPESKRKVGFLPERPYFYQYLTAFEFLDFYGTLFELPKELRHDRIHQLLERVHLTRFADVPLRTFSKGMLQRAGVAQALINDPELVIMDEPMSGLDPMGRALIRDILFEERENGRTVFFSSHILADVEAICDRVAILLDGELHGCGTVDELVGSQTQHVDVVFEGDCPDGLKPHRRQQLRLPPDGVDAALDALRAAGCSIVRVTPVRMHLEEVFVDAAARRKKVDAKRLGVLA
jgi:ABC-2 type transport system ATP-binding protein